MKFGPEFWIIEICHTCRKMAVSQVGACDDADIKVLQYSSRCYKFTLLSRTVDLSPG